MSFVELEPEDLPEKYHPEMVGRTEDLDINQARSTKYGDIQVSLEEQGVVLFNDEYFARFRNGGQANDRAIDVLYLMAGEPEEASSNPFWFEDIPERYDVREVVNEVYSANSGPETWKFNPGARLALFTDEEGRLPEETREEASDLIDGFLTSSMYREEWLEDIPQMAERYRRQGEDVMTSVDKAVKNSAKSYPQSPSTIKQYLSGHAEELRSTDFEEEAWIQSVLSDISIEQEGKTDREVEDNEDWENRKSSLMSDINSSGS